MMQEARITTIWSDGQINVTEGVHVNVKREEIQRWSQIFLEGEFSPHTVIIDGKTFGSIMVKKDGFFPFVFEKKQ